MAIIATPAPPAETPPAPPDWPSGPDPVEVGSRTRRRRPVRWPRLPDRRRGGRLASPPGVLFVSLGLLILGALALTFVAQLTVLGALQHNRDRIVTADSFRGELANATAPVGPLDDGGKPLALGTPVALIEIPVLGVHEVVGEGTTSGITARGPGHRRDSALPGQAGVSVLMGRSSAFGASFRGIRALRAGDRVITTTGQGTMEFVVTGVRRAGDPLPRALDAGTARLLLVTADGPLFQPTGVVMVDARAVSQPYDVGPQLRSAYLTEPERVMAGDVTSTNLFPLVLWAQLLLILLGALVWSALRWGRWETWLVGVPTVLAVALAVADHLCRTLPNLL